MDLTTSYDVKEVNKGLLQVQGKVSSNDTLSPRVTMFTIEVTVDNLLHDVAYEQIVVRTEVAPVLRGKTPLRVGQAVFTLQAGETEKRLDLVVRVLPQPDYAHWPLVIGLAFYCGNAVGSEDALLHRELIPLQSGKGSIALFCCVFFFFCCLLFFYFLFFFCYQTAFPPIYFLLIFKQKR